MSYYYFEDYPEFMPMLSPKKIFKMGSFGGTYWRPIYSSVTNKNYKNQHLKYGWGLDESIMSCSEYDKTKNKYGVKCGTSLEYWEDKGWINKQDPYGWVQWYTEFYYGRRTKDDHRQIKRWINISNRMNGLLRLNPNSAKIKQTLQHWAIKC